MSNRTTASSEGESFNKIRFESSLESPLPKSNITSFEDLHIISKMRRSRFPIYLVASKEDKKRYVMKVFPFEKQEISPHFLREAVIKDLSHPNLIKIIHTQEETTVTKHEKTNKFSYLLMELAPFGDFCALIMQDKLLKNDKLIRTYFHQLIEGLEHLHSNGIAHMDLKLDNLLLGEDYNLKITDFDSIQTEFDEHYSAAGTMDYRAPEVINKRIYNPMASDIYSVGIVLFQLKFHFFPYTEGMPIKGHDLHDILLNTPEDFWNILSSITKACDNCDEQFKELFLSMVNKDPARRPTIEQIKNSEWYKGPIFSNKELEFVMRHLVGKK